MSGAGVQPRLFDYLDHMEEAVHLAIGYAESLDKFAFLSDKRTQQAVIMNILIIGEAAGKIATEYPEFVIAHPQIPWREMRGMRNRMAHGYFDINLDIVWETVQKALPALGEQIQKLSAVKSESAS